MGGRTTATSSSSHPVNSWTGPTAEEVLREIPHLRNTNSRNTKYREKCRNMKMQISRNPKNRVNILGSQLGRKCGRKPSVISPTPTWSLLLALHPFHLRNTISRNTKYREKCKNMKRQISPTPTWSLLALHPFSCQLPSFAMKRGKTIFIPHKSYLSGLQTQTSV